jgi:hypothetical protein
MAVPKILFSTNFPLYFRISPVFMERNAFPISQSRKHKVTYPANILRASATFINYDKCYIRTFDILTAVGNTKQYRKGFAVVFITGYLLIKDVKKVQFCT